MLKLQMSYNGFPESVPFPPYSSGQLARGIAALHRKKLGCEEAPDIAIRSPGPQLEAGAGTEDGLETWNTPE